MKHNYMTTDSRNSSGDLFAPTLAGKMGIVSLPTAVL